MAWSPLERFEAGGAAGLWGNACRLGLAGELRDAVVRYSVEDVRPTLSVQPIPGLRLTVRGGVSLQRRLEIDAADGGRILDGSLAPGRSVGVSAAWLVPPAEGS